MLQSTSSPLLSLKQQFAKANMMMSNVNASSEIMCDDSDNCTFDILINVDPGFSWYPIKLTFNVPIISTITKYRFYKAAFISNIKKIQTIGINMQNTITSLMNATYVQVAQQFTGFKPTAASIRYTLGNYTQLLDNTFKMHYQVARVGSRIIKSVNQYSVQQLEAFIDYVNNDTDSLYWTYANLLNEPINQVMALQLTSNDISTLQGYFDDILT